MFPMHSCGYRTNQPICLPVSVIWKAGSAGGRPRTMCGWGTNQINVQELARCGGNTDLYQAETTGGNSLHPTKQWMGPTRGGYKRWTFSDSMDKGARFASFSCQLQVNAARVSHFFDAETCEFSQVPSLFMDVHETLRYTLYLHLTFIN